MTPSGGHVEETNAPRTCYACLTYVATSHCIVLLPNDFFCAVFPDPALLLKSNYLVWYVYVVLLNTYCRGSFFSFRSWFAGDLRVWGRTVVLWKLLHHTSCSKLFGTAARGAYLMHTKLPWVRPSDRQAQISSDGQSIEIIALRPVTRLKSYVPCTAPTGLRKCHEISKGLDQQIARVFTSSLCVSLSIHFVRDLSWFCHDFELTWSYLLQPFSTCTVRVQWSINWLRLWLETIKIVVHVWLCMLQDSCTYMLVFDLLNHFWSNLCTIITCSAATCWSRCRPVDACEHPNVCLGMQGWVEMHGYTKRLQCFRNHKLDSKSCFVKCEVKVSSLRLSGDFSMAEVSERKWRECPRSKFYQSHYVQLCHVGTSHLFDELKPAGLYFLVSLRSFPCCFMFTC